MRRAMRAMGWLSIVALIVAAGCSGTGSEQQALDAARGFVDDATTAAGLTGLIGEAARHGPWWEVTVAFEE